MPSELYISCERAGKTYLFEKNSPKLLKNTMPLKEPQSISLGLGIKVVLRKACSKVPCVRKELTSHPKYLVQLVIYVTYTGKAWIPAIIQTKVYD